MLLFKKRFLSAIRSGQKRQTIRIWKFRRMRPGQRSYIPGVGYIRVLKVEAIELDQLTDEDALADGFPSADALCRELHELYPDGSTSGRKAYRVTFELTDPPPKSESRQPS